MLLPGVVEAGQPQVEPRWAEPAQVPADRVRPADRNDGDALGGEVAAAARRERLERAPVARALDEDDRTRPTGNDGGATCACAPAVPGGS